MLNENSIFKCRFYITQLSLLTTQELRDIGNDEKEMISRRVAAKILLRSLSGLEKDLASAQ